MLSVPVQLSLAHLAASVFVAGQRRRAEKNTGHRLTVSAAMPRITACLVADRLRVGARMAAHDPTKAEEYASFVGLGPPYT